MKYLILLSLALLCSSCGEVRRVDYTLDEVEVLMNDAPAEALERLQQLRADQLRRPRLRARYALLYTQAQCKNFIYPESDSLIRMAIDYYDCVGDPHESALAYYYLGALYYNAEKARQIKAAEAYFTAEALASQTDDEYLKGLIDLAIGAIYLEQYGFDEALARFKDGERHFRMDGGTPRNMAVLAELQADAYKRLRLPAAADSCYRCADSIYGANNCVADLFRVRRRYVSLVEERYGADSAFRYLEALQMWGKLQGVVSTDRRSSLYMQWGLMMGLHFKAGNLDSVRYYGEKCLKEGDYKSKRALLECLTLLEEVEYRAGNYARAREYANRYLQMQDSLYGDQYLYFMQAIDEQKQNDILTLVNRRLKVDTRNQRVMLWALSILLVSVGLLIGWGVRRWRVRMREKERQARAELEALQRSYSQMCTQLENLKLHDGGKDEQESQLYKALEERLIGLRDLMLVFQMGKPSDFAKNFKKYTEVNLHSRYALSELQFVVNRKYYGMVDYLRRHYPELNKHDLDLCCLMCFGFSQQGICFMYGYDDVGSFYNRRSRLRRKLNLPSDARIEDFIADLMRQLAAEKQHEEAE